MTTPASPNDERGATGTGTGADNAYLWDRSGTPDPLVERLETLLAPNRLRHVGDLQATPAADSRHARSFRVSKYSALAALILLAFGVGAWFAFPRQQQGGWEVAATNGAPQVNGGSLRAGRMLRVGAWLETDEKSSARMQVASIGTLEVLAGSRLRITETAPDKHEVELAHGAIRASILAPPRLFFVQTRAALATDMGCRYDLEMPETGPGMLTVTLGWVLLEGRGGANGTPWAARVPQGVRCMIDPQRGPGTPFRVGSPHASILNDFDQRAWADISDEELNTLLHGCGRSDSVTLWHLLYRIDTARRPDVVERLRAVLSLPSNYPQRQLIALDPDAMERLWGEVIWAR